MEIQASCQCAQVQFSSLIKPVIQLCCHCTQCRDAVKADYASIVFFRLESVKLVGKTDYKNYVADSGAQTHREYCAKCDDVMYDRSEGFPTLIGVMANKIQNNFEFKPVCHVWTKEKLPKVAIDEGVICYPEGIP